MLFRTVDHYFTQDDILLLYEEDNEEPDCFICYELLNENEQLIKLNNNAYYFKKCNCEGFIHKKCLDKWFNSKKSCPVCRFLIDKKIVLTDATICKKSHGAFFYNNLKVIKKNWIVFLFIFFTIDFVCKNIALFFGALFSLKRQF